MFWIILAFVVGSWFGLLVAGLCVAAANGDRHIP